MTPKDENVLNCCTVGLGIDWNRNRCCTGIELMDLFKYFHSYRDNVNDKENGKV